MNNFGESLPEIDIKKLNVKPEHAEGVTKITEKASTIFGRSPAKRTYELERILADILVSIKANTIYIVAEDVDRSGTDGIHFLETLNYFLKNNEQLLNSPKKIIVIAPMSDRAYADFDNRESLLKCIDLFIEYNPKVKNMDEFLKCVFTDEVLGKNESGKYTHLELFSDYFSALLETPKVNINIRKIKAILRHTNQKYKELLSREIKADWRAVLVAETMRFCDRDEHESMLEFSRRHGVVPGGTYYSSMLRTIYNPNEGLYSYQYSNSRDPKTRSINKHAGDHKITKVSEDVTVGVWSNWEQNSQSEVSYVADFYFK